MKQSRPATAPPAAPKPTGTNPVFGLLGAARALEARLEASMADVGLSMAKFGVLRALAAADDPLTLTELASCQRCVRSNITQLVDRLEADGLVKRVDDSSDRRSIRATLTPVGRQKHAAGERQLAMVMRDVSASLSADDRDALGRVVAALR